MKIIKLLTTMISASLLMSVVQANSDIVEEELDDFFDSDMPVVLSVTRLKQPRTEAPASVTIIDRETIQSLGTRNLAEILRLVPGMYVGYERGHVPEVGYHVLAGENSRYLQVLVDGRSIYQAALARILWDDLPLPVEKISKIEVIRGPNTAMYGANSYLAVINIITLHPEDRMGFHAITTQGNHGIDDTHASYATQINDLSLDMMVGKHSDDGFEITKQGDDRVDGHNATYYNADMKWIQNDTDYLRFQFGKSKNVKQMDDVDSGEVTPYHDLNVDNQYTHLTWNNNISSKHEFKIQAFSTKTLLKEQWQTCMPALFLSEELFDLFALDANYTNALITALLTGQSPPIPDSSEVLQQAQLVMARLALVGAESACGYANQNMSEKRKDVELQYIYTNDENFRLVSGASYRKDTVSSDTYFNGVTSKSIWRVFSNIEWRLTEKWLANWGAMYEMDELVGNDISPRFALNYLVSPEQSFRFIYSKANRSPDLFEDTNDRSYTLTNVQTNANIDPSFTTYYQHTASPGGLEYEQIYSKEIGWYYRSNKQQFEADIKIFEDTLYNLLSGITQLGEFELNNSAQVTIQGIEGTLEFKPSASSRLWINLTSLDYKDPSRVDYKESGSPLSASIHSQMRFDNQLNISNSFYYYKDWHQANFKRFDTSLSYRFDFAETYLETKLTYEHRFDDNYLLDTRSRYKNPDKIYASISYHW